MLLAEDVKALNQPLIEGCKLLLAIMTTYIAVSFILQTRDDYRFIIPYVEFTRATKGARPMLLDTSVIIDGRISDMAATGIFESRLLVPRFVLTELQTIADSGDRLKRSRGRRGLDILQKLQANPEIGIAHLGRLAAQLARDRRRGSKTRRPGPAGECPDCHQ